VTFFDGSTQLGTATLSAGSAPYTTSSLAAGTHSITAQYGGDADDTASTSASFTQTIVAPAFALSANPTSLTISQGSSGTVTLTATPAGGFSQQISFSCSGLPAYATCTFAPATLTPSGSAAVSTTLTIATNVKSASAALDGNGGPLNGRPDERKMLFAFLGLGLIALLRARRRAGSLLGVLGSSVLAILLAVSLAVVAGCGGGAAQDKTPVGSSTVTITASGGSAAQTAAITVTVQ
jgi:hypothetical protein